jgi:hypothetical protein
MRIIVKDDKEYQALLATCRYIYETQVLENDPILNFLAGIYDSEDEVRDLIVSVKDHDSMVYWDEECG